MVEVITSTDGTLHALVIRQPTYYIRRRQLLSSNPAGLATRFFTDCDASLQVGAMTRKAGEVVAPHKHAPPPRTVTETAEVLVFLNGMARVGFYAADGERQWRQVSGGDVVVLLKGGHGVEYLEDTELLEVKQGPFMDDKVLL